MERMTPEQQRIAIAEACGWTDFSSAPYEGAIQYGRRPFSCSDSWVLPDYLNDLNAMHEAVKSLPQNLKPRYFACLCTVAGAAISLNGYSEATEATAAQRARAFLETLGLWDNGSA